MLEAHRFLRRGPTNAEGWSYAQLSFAFNYYGPTGSQRDEVTVLRKRVTELSF